MKLSRWFYVAAFALVTTWMSSPVQAQYTRFAYPTGPAHRQLSRIAATPDGNVWAIANTLEYNYPSSLLRITPAGTITEFPIGPTFDFRYKGLIDLVAGPDGVLWLINTIDNTLTRVGLDGTVINAYPIPADTTPQSLVVGPDGAMWFVESSVNKIARMTTAGVLTEFIFAQSSSPNHPKQIAAGTDGALWFTASSDDGVQVVRITTSGTMTNFPVPPPTASGVVNGIDYITAGPDGNMWFSSYDSNSIGRITPSGAITQFSLPTSQTGPGPGFIIAGPDGALWFTVGAYSNGHPNGLGRITTAGVYTEFLTPTTYTTFPRGVALGADGSLWITDNGTSPSDFSQAVYRFTVPASTATSPLVAATLPTSRSVQVGSTATVFATMINTAAVAATDCGVAPITITPGGFTFQTTDSATNALTGQINKRVAIPPNGAQSFVLAFKAGGPLAAVDTKLAFGCNGVVPALPVTGLNTVLLSFDSNPVPDIIALGASADPGIVDIPGNSGSGLFAVATFNVGASAPITVTADTGAASLPLSISICQSNPQTAACTSAKGASVTTTINQNASPTFDIFVDGSGNVPFNPANNRIFVRFKDANGVIRGSTSVAVRTQ